MPNNTNCSRHCAFKLSGFMDHNNVDVKSLNLCVDEFIQSQMPKSAKKMCHSLEGRISSYQLSQATSPMYLITLTRALLQCIKGRCIRHLLRLIIAGSGYNFVDFR